MHRYLETNLLTNPNYTSAQIHLLRPSISYSLTRRAEPASGMLPPLDGYSHVFVPINNNPDPTQVGGTHWSLLLVSLLDRMAFHYDSAHSSNWKQAQRATHNLSRYLKVDLELRDLPDSPQQRNYVDCGPFVCCEISYLLRERLLKHYKYDRVNMSLGRVSIDAHDMRKKLLQTIINERNGIQ